MDTDIVSLLEAGMETVPVLTGISTRADAERFAYRLRRDRPVGADLEVDIGVGGSAEGAPGFTHPPSGQQN